MKECEHELNEGKEEHVSTLRKLCRLGSDRGFVTFHRYRPNISCMPRAYQPIIDLVWALDMKEESFDYENYVSFVRMLGISENEARYIPVVSFEVESSDPTSKVVSADLLNLLSTHSRFSFLVIKRKEGLGTMSVKRAERIVRTFNYFEGYKSVHVIDSSFVDMLDKYEYKLPECMIPEFAGLRRWKGACKGMSGYNDLCSVKKVRECVGFGLKCKLYEDSDDGIRCVFAYLAWSVGLVPCYFYKPREVLPSYIDANRYHVPRLDTVLFLCLSREQRDGLARLLSLSELESRSDICHLPLFGVEIEGVEAGKHSIGSIVGLSRYSYYKILVTKEKKGKNKGLGRSGLNRAIRAFSGIYGKSIFSISTNKLTKWARERIR